MKISVHQFSEEISYSFTCPNCNECDDIDDDPAYQEKVTCTNCDTEITIEHD